MPSYRAAIAPERLESCIRRLDPADRALLDLSLNRRIPDASMAGVLRTDPMRLAWKRARALERVASRLGLHSPSDLAEVRIALTELPSRAWLPLELQAVPVPRALEPPEPKGAEVRVHRSPPAAAPPPPAASSSTQALTVRETSPEASREVAPVARVASRTRGFARTAGAVLVGAAAALAFRRR